MDPLTLLSIGSTLLKAGPALLRGVGGLFGGKTAEVTDKVAGLMDELKGSPADQAEARMAEMLQSLSPTELLELKRIDAEVRLELARIDAQREKTRLDTDSAQFAQSQETIRTEAEHGTDYVKETRPKIARLSFYAGTFYALGTHAVKLALIAAASPAAASVAVDAGLLATLYGPVGFYMTMRTVDAFSGKGKS